MTIATIEDPAGIWKDLPHTLPQNRGEYSIARALRRLADPNGRGVVDGIEGETSQEIARRSGRSIDGQGFFMPWDAREHRSLTAATGGGSITALRAPTIIDVLRQKMVTARLGAQTLPDLVGGQFFWPRKTSTASVGWVAEAGAPPASSFTSASGDFMKFVPCTTGAYTDYTRWARDLIPGLDEAVVDDLLASIAVEIDRVALNGPGNGFQPLGLAQNPSVVVAASLGTNGGAPTYAAVCAVEQALANANADTGRLGWVTTPNGRAKLRQVEAITGGGRPIWTNKQEVLGWPAEATNLLPSTMVKGSSGAVLSPLIFGNFADMVIGLWGAAQITRDPYTASTTGNVRIVALVDVDVQLRHSASFNQLIDMAT